MTNRGPKPKSRRTAAKPKPKSKRAAPSYDRGAAELRLISKTARGVARGAVYWVPRALAAGLVASLVWVGLYRFVPPPTTLLILSQAASGRAIERRWVPIGRVSPHLVNAVIGAEDSKFCRHWGFDTAAVQDALESNKKGGPVRGASTLSQQTAKNAFLWPSRSWVRKGLEAYFTVVMEALWPKRRIMEVYLNVAEFGPGVFGAEAAAREFYGKTARQLSAREAATLASVLPSPRKWSAAAPGPYVIGRARMLERRARVVASQGLSACVLKKQ